MDRARLHSNLRNERLKMGAAVRVFIKISLEIRWIDGVSHVVDNKDHCVWYCATASLNQPRKWAKTWLNLKFETMDQPATVQCDGFGNLYSRDDEQTNDLPNEDESGVLFYVNKDGFPVEKKTWERMWHHVEKIHPKGSQMVHGIRQCQHLEKVGCWITSWRRYS